MKYRSDEEADEIKIQEISARGMKDAAFKAAVIVTPVLVSIMLGCLIGFFRWSVNQHHTAELVAREHSKAIESLVDWQKQWKGYPIDSEDLVRRSERATDTKLTKLQGETQAAITLLSGQIGALQASIGELKGYVQGHNGVAKQGQ